MPNHITNAITFGTDEQARAAFQKMLAYVKRDDSFLGSIDFNKLIPMPASLNIEAGSRGEQGLEIVRAFLHEGVDVTMDTFKKPAKTPGIDALCKRYRKTVERDTKILDLGWKYYNNICEHGSPTWYEWSIEHWGTKWNAYDFIPADKHTDTLRFNTAWDGVPKIAALISKQFSDQTLLYRYADEDIGHNVGEIAFTNGDRISENIPHAGSRKAYEMAASIINIDLAKYGYVLTKDKKSYAYDEAKDHRFWDYMSAIEKKIEKPKTKKSKGKSR